MSSSKLFQPTQVGNITLKHRVVLAPLTRFRADKDHIPFPPVTEYYAQRASTRGTLLITEATFIAARAGGFANIPGIWNDEQVAAWKKVADAVHANGSFIFMQLWALGRAAVPTVLKSEDPTFPYVSASDLKHPPKNLFAPRPLTLTEIKEYVQLYATAAHNAVHRAGFDGVEIHGANGYLVDQFLQDVSNKRTDAYGGSIENRVRFGLEIIDAVVKEVGAERTAIRLSPWGSYGGMRMADPVPTFTHFVSRIRELHPNFAYVHLVEPRIDGDRDRKPSELGDESTDVIRKVWSPKPLITCGAYNRDSAIATADATGDLIAFGRHFIANPDLPKRLREDIPFNAYNRSTFYRPIDASGKGYTDYPFAQSPKL